MSKAVLISINPNWCDFIKNGIKTVEVRKSRPKLDVPFKVYIYCTIHGCSFLVGGKHPLSGNGMVVGEFVCDRIYTYSTCACADGMTFTDMDMIEMSCMTKSELEAYEMSAEPKENAVYKVGLFAWHISDLKIYDRPRELSEFNIKRPPQSWQYVEECK
ncbi:MAG: hypothetical protein ACI4Q6_00950 [Huintestinicola sp.]